MALTDMVGVGDEPIQPPQNKIHGPAVARRTLRFALDVHNSLAVIPLVGNKRGGKLPVCPSAIPTLKNAELVVIYVSRRVDCLSAAGSSGEQLPAAAGAGNKLQRDNYNEIPLALFLKM